MSTQAHYKKYTFQAITVTSPNTGYNRCFNAAEEILKHPGRTIFEFPIVRLSPGEKRTEDEMSPLLTVLSISEGENGPIIKKSDQEIIGIGARTTASMADDLKDDSVQIDFNIMNRVYMGLQETEASGEYTIFMPVFEQFGVETSGTFALNKWYYVGGRSKGNDIVHLLVRVLAPDSTHVKSIIPDLIIKK